MKWQKGFTAEEAGLTVAGFEDDSSIEEVERKISNNDYQYDDESLWNCANEARQIKKGLLLEVSRIDQGYPSVLEVFLWSDEQSKIMLTAESLAMWFYEVGGLDSAQRILPSFKVPKESAESLRDELIKSKQEFLEYKVTAAKITGVLRKEIESLLEENRRLATEEKNNLGISDFDVSSYPSGINNAIQVFNECWSHLSDDMQRPSKDNLVGFIRAALRQTEKSAIESLLKLSTPDNDRYGGKGKKGQIKPWKPKSLN